MLIHVTILVQINPFNFKIRLESNAALQSIIFIAGLYIFAMAAIYMQSKFFLLYVVIEAKQLTIKRYTHSVTKYIP